MNARSRRNGSAGNPVKFGEPRPKPPLICGALRGVLAAAFTWKSGHPWRPLSLPFFFSFSPTTCQLSGTAPLLVRAPANLLRSTFNAPCHAPARKKTKTTRLHPHYWLQRVLIDRWKSFRACFRFRIFHFTSWSKNRFKFRSDEENLRWRKKINRRRNQVYYVFLSPRKKNIWFAVDDVRTSLNDLSTWFFFNGHFNVPLLSSF